MGFIRRHAWTVAVVFSLPVFVIVGLAWVALSDKPVLIATLDADGRQAFYGALSSAAGALLGFTITALSILIALPSGEAVAALRKYRGWQTLFELLVVTIALLGVLLVVSLVALAADVGDTSREKLSVIVAASSASAAVGIAAVTLFFSLVVSALIQQWHED